MANETQTTKWTPGPWHLCKHLQSVEDDAACPCGYRGVIWGPGDDDRAICQPGHDPALPGEEGLEPGRYPRETEIANAHLIAAAPELYEAGEKLYEYCCGVRDGKIEATPTSDLGHLFDMYKALAKARGEQPSD